MSSSNISVAKGTGAGMALELGAPILSTTRVVMGAGSSGPAEMTVGEVEGQRPKQTKAELEAEFWQRVREKATAKASAILTQAQADAERMKMEAQEKGYQDGMQAAAGDFEAHIASMSEAFGQTLGTLQQGRGELWRQFGGELVALVHMAVAKAVGVTLTERRGEILAHLLDEALEQLETSSALTVRVYPGDEEALTELLVRAKAANPALSAWRIRAEEGLTPGSILLECGDGVVDNRLDSRMQAVQAILDKLSFDDLMPDEHFSEQAGEQPHDAVDPSAHYAAPEQHFPEEQAPAFDPAILEQPLGDAPPGYEVEFAGHEAAEAFLEAQGDPFSPEALETALQLEENLPALEDWQPPEGFGSGGS